MAKTNFVARRNRNKSVKLLNENKRFLENIYV